MGDIGRGGRFAGGGELAPFGRVVGVGEGSFGEGCSGGDGVDGDVVGGEFDPQCFGQHANGRFGHAIGG